MEDNAITEKEIKEQVRLSIIRLVRDALELNDRQTITDEMKIECEKEILEDAELIFDYFKLQDIETMGLSKKR